MARGCAELDQGRISLFQSLSPLSLWIWDLICLGSFWKASCTGPVPAEGETRELRVTRIMLTLKGPLGTGVPSGLAAVRRWALALHLRHLGHPQQPRGFGLNGAIQPGRGFPRPVKSEGPVAGRPAWRPAGSSPGPQLSPCTARLS